MAHFEITADSLIEVSQASFADLKIYTMNDHDRELARPGAIFLDKMIRAPWVRPAERITIAKLQHVSPIEKPAPDVSEREGRIVSIRFQPSQCLQPQP